MLWAIGLVLETEARPSARAATTFNCQLIFSAPYWLLVHNSSFVNTIISKYTQYVWTRQECVTLRAQRKKHRALPPMFAQPWLKEENLGKKEKLGGGSFTGNYNIESSSYFPLKLINQSIHVRVKQLHPRDCEISRLREQQLDVGWDRRLEGVFMDQINI